MLYLCFLFSFSSFTHEKLSLFLSYLLSRSLHTRISFVSLVLYFVCVFLSRCLYTKNSLSFYPIFLSRSLHTRNFFPFFCALLTFLNFALVVYTREILSFFFIFFFSLVVYTRELLSFACISRFFLVVYTREIIIALSLSFFFSFYSRCLHTRFSFLLCFACISCFLSRSLHTRTSIAAFII